MRNEILAMALLCTLTFSACKTNQENNEEALKDTAQITDSLPPFPAKDSLSEGSKSAAEAKHDSMPLPVPLTIVVENLKSAEAPVEMSLYGPQSKFPDKDGQLKKYRFKPQNGKVVATITDLAYGDLAVALYQDIDSDGEINKNGVGIPTEPYAFSNNFRPKIKAPAFKDCKFAYNEKENTVHIALLKK
jgi:uncharacterized protein (DUF2141 family)